MLRLRPPSAAIALTLIAALSTAACSTSPDTSDGQQAAATTADPSATTTSAVPVPVSAEPGALYSVTPWFVLDDGISPGEPRVVAGPDVLRATLDTLLAGPTETDTAFGLGTGISPRVTVASVAIEGDTATVDLSRAFETADTQPQVAQVVYSLTELAGVAKVKFLIDGEDNGATGVNPLGRADTRVQPTA